MDLIPREQNWIPLRQPWSKRYVYCGDRSETLGLIRDCGGDKRVRLGGVVWRDWARASPTQRPGGLMSCVLCQESKKCRFFLMLCPKLFNTGNLLGLSAFPINTCS